MLVLILCQSPGKCTDNSVSSNTFENNTCKVGTGTDGYIQEALIHSSMNDQSTKKVKCDFTFFFIFNGLTAIEYGSTSLCCGNAELIRTSLGIFVARFIALSFVTVVGEAEIRRLANSACRRHTPLILFSFTGYEGYFSYTNKQAPQKNLRGLFIGGGGENIRHIPVAHPYGPWSRITDHVQICVRQI